MANTYNICLFRPAVTCTRGKFIGKIEKNTIFFGSKAIKQMINNTMATDRVGNIILCNNNIMLRRPLLHLRPETR